MAKTASTVIKDPYEDHIVGYSSVIGKGDVPVYDWDIAPGTNAQGQTEADVYTNWLNKGLINTSAPKYTGALRLGNTTIANPEAYGMENEARSQWGEDYTDWLNRTGGDNRMATAKQLENPRLAEDIPTVTNNRFRSTEEIIDNISKAGWVVIRTGENKQLTAVDESKGDSGVRSKDVVVARYNPATGSYSDARTFQVVDYGDHFATTQAMDAAGGKGLMTADSTNASGQPTGVPGMALGARAASMSNAGTILPYMPENMTLSGYRALSTTQRQSLKTAVEVRGKDWNEYLSGLKDPAPAVVSYAELRTMNASDKATLRQQVEDAGLSWSDYVDQIFSPWSASFNSPRRVTYATYRG